MKPQLFRSLFRSANIPPVGLSTDDLRRLHELLEKKVVEARQIQLDGLKRTEQVEDKQWEDLKRNVHDQFVLSVIVLGKNGERLMDTTGTPLLQENLPDEIITISFESSYFFQTYFNIEPRNKIELIIHFQRQKLVDFSNASGGPTTPVSYYNITGDNETWVNGVFESLQTFFKSRELKRNFVHGNYFYDLLLWIIVLPCVFWLLHRFAGILESQGYHLSGTLGVGFFIYLGIVMLLMFRFLFNYLRWLYPRTEHTDSRVKPTRLHRVVLFTVGTGVMSMIIYDFLKAIL